VEESGPGNLNRTAKIKERGSSPDRVRFSGEGSPAKRLWFNSGEATGAPGRRRCSARRGDLESLVEDLDCMQGGVGGSAGDARGGSVLRATTRSLILYEIDSTKGVSGSAQAR
jgi:hypothetical protein